MNGLSDSQPWEIRTAGLQAIARAIARDVESWAKEEPNPGVVLFEFFWELVSHARARIQAAHPLEPCGALSLHLVRCLNKISTTTNSPAEADYLLGLLLANELMRPALDPLFQAWREARTAATKEGGDAQPK